ncbi:MAG: DUF3576 domain-containing protein [Alphaproteobacteria bacterium]|nr:DUF3576 domain-containing protein [Alphaproteobacteria bacterium]
MVLGFTLAACGGGRFGSLLKGTGEKPDQRSGIEKNEPPGKLFDLFTNVDNPNVTIGVNKYIWNATLDVLSFLPVEAADPFSGVIVMGWGRPSGSARSYRATVYIQDPALDARSLRVALVSKSGPANRDTVRAIEDAILTRARQMRIADSKL